MAFGNAPAFADTEVAPVGAQIYQQIGFSVLLDMNFGSIAANNSGGVITLDPVTGTRNCGTTVCAGSYSMSRLELTGSDTDVRVTYDPSFTLTGPGSPMTVVPYTAGGQGEIVHLTGGFAVVDFGAQITVNPGQVAGSYSGNFDVNVEYQ